MRKVRRILMVLLMLNFFIGVEGGMKAVNLAMIIGNGALVILVAVVEIKSDRR